MLSPLWRGVLTICLLATTATGEEPAAAARMALTREISADAATRAPRVTVFADGRVDFGGVAGEQAEKLAYGSTIGEQITAVGANLRLADDLVLSVRDGAELSRYVFWVTGQANPAQPSDEPYTVEFALHEYCPGAGGAVIPGTEGSVTISDPAMLGSLIRVEFVPDPGVTVPQSLWWSFRSSRSNVGFLSGAHPTLGFSNDVVDLPGFACAANFGGWFRNEPYASFNFELWVNEPAADSFVGYRNIYAAGPGIVTGGGDAQYADDIELQVDSCRMTGYEIGIRNFGFYQFDLRADDRGFPASELIPGTAKTFFNNTTTGFRLARYTFDPPIELPEGRIWATFKVNNPSGGWVLAGNDATIGETDGGYVRRNSDLSDWVYQSWVPNLPQYRVGFYVVVHCEGEPANGACCDMFNTDENGDSVCRELPRMNCAIPGPSFEPGWTEGAACEPDPFPFTCGLAACCTPQDDCVELTERECEALEPLEAGRLWSRGSYCESRDCPYSACLALGESCTTPTWGGRGCDDSFCCTRVCAVDAWCCEVEWDDSCALRAQLGCSVENEFDRCAEGDGYDGATPLTIGESLIFSLRNTIADSFEPGFSCHDGPTRVCQGASNAGQACASQDDCYGFCPPRTPAPGLEAHRQAWFRVDPTPAFAEDDAALRVTTCFPNDHDPDTLLQVFSAPGEEDGICEGVGRCSDGSACDTDAACAEADGTCHAAIVGCNTNAPNCPLDASCVPSLKAPCHALRVEACNDDAGPDICPEGQRLSELCLGDLDPDRPYFIMIGEKEPSSVRPESERLTILAELVDGCSGTDAPANDYCRNAVDALPGETPFTTQDATIECPSAAGSECSQPSFEQKNDVWFRFTAVDSGRVDFSTCVDTEDPARDFAIYTGCDCPTVSATVLESPTAQATCGDDVTPFPGCLSGNRIREFAVEAGECYLIRIAEKGFRPLTGTLVIRASGDDCDGNGITDRCELDCGSPGSVCDVAGCGIAGDCDADGILDVCEGVSGQCCPPDGIDWIDPLPGVVDAARPVLPSREPPYVGIDRIHVRTPFTWRPDCWSLVETTNNQGLWPSYPLQDAFNRVVELTPTEDGTVVVRLQRPIAPGECGTVTYRTDPGLGETTASATFCAHPGDVNGDGCSSAVDIISLIDAINGTSSAAWGELSTNCDRNSATGPADITCLIDLLNDGWLGVGCE